MKHKTTDRTKRRHGLNPVLVTSLCACLFSAVSLPTFAHPEPSNTPKAESMTDKHKDMRARAKAQREKANERAAKRRAEANERREKHKQEAALRRAERQKVTDKYLVFKTELLALLKQDGVIASEDEPVEIEYVDGDPIANSVNLTENFGDKYKALWDEHGRSTTDHSVIRIRPGSYEIKERTESGGSHHFVMQTD